MTGIQTRGRGRTTTNKIEQTKTQNKVALAQPQSTTQYQPRPASGQLDQSTQNQLQPTTSNIEQAKIVRRAKTKPKLINKPKQINTQGLTPLGKFGLGIYNTGSDYANILNTDYEDKSILNQAIGHAFEGKWDKAGQVIQNNPYRFAGNLAVEVGSALIPVGAVLKAAKAGKIVKNITRKSWKAPDSNPLSKAKQNNIRQLKNIKNSPGEPQRYQTGFDDTIKKVENAKSFDDIKKIQLDFKAYGPDVTTPLQQSVTSKISIQVKKVKSKITGSKSITGSGTNVSDEVLFSSKHAADPSIYAYFSSDPINAGKVHLNVGADMFRFTDDELIRQVGGSISEEVIHNTLRKDIGVKAAKQWDPSRSRPFFNARGRDYYLGVSGKDIKNIATGRGVGNDTGKSINTRPENPGQQWYRWTGKQGPSKESDYSAAEKLADIWSTKYYTPKVKSNPKILPNPVPFSAKLIEKNEEKNKQSIGGYGQFF
jgi:hypothetical protein